VTRAVVLTIALLGLSTAAGAQTPSPSQPDRRFIVSGGLSWLGGYGLGITTATLRRNEPGTATPDLFTLFQADTSLERTFGLDTRLAYALSPAFEVEVGGAFSQPKVSASISQDQEGEPVVLSDQQLMQFTLEGSLLWNVAAIDLGPRAMPYVIGGAGYLRQVDDDRANVETGLVTHIGGGVRYWLTGDARSRRAFGLRGEARLQFRSGGLEFEDKVRMAPALNVLATFAF
jgi:hypothetical protein